MFRIHDADRGTSPDRVSQVGLLFLPRRIVLPLPGDSGNLPLYPARGRAQQTSLPTAEGRKAIFFAAP